MAPAIAPAALFGLIIGSFLNVVTWRLPRRQSLVTPGSYCPGCEKPVAPYDNVPIFSWLLLRGRCRGCRTRISARYPLVEALTCALYAAAALTADDAEQLVLAVVLITFLVPISFIDLEHRIIPNRLTAPAAILAVAIVAVLAPSDLPEQLACGAGALLFFALPAFVSKKGMGMGDVKLAGVLGLYLGLAVIPAIFIALVLGVLAGVLVIARQGMTAGRRAKVPFGPFMAAGAVVALFVGDVLVSGYLDRL